MAAVAGPPIGIVAGSGIQLRELFDCAVMEQSFAEIPGLTPGGVLGHEHTFLHGTCRDVPIILQSGRLHFYEGLDYTQVTKPVDVLYRHGVRTIVFTNAAGGLEPSLQPGSLVAIDAVRLWPYLGWQGRPEMVRTDFSIPGCDATGEYWWVHGPSYETRAEIKALQALGGTVVGMSTAPELVRCHELGIRTAAIACVTNNCCDETPLTHDDVLDAAKAASAQLVDLIANWL